MFNNRVVTVFTLKNLLKNIIIVQRNKIQHLINRLQIKKFTQNAGRDIVIFPAKHSYTKKYDGKSLLYKDLFPIQDGKHGILTGLGLLYDCKEIPVVVLSNMYTLLKIVNGAYATTYGIFTHPNSIYSTPNC